MKKAIFAGTFDPFTLGHKDILIQGLKVFDKITIAIAENTGRQSVAPIEDRIAIIDKSLRTMNMPFFRDAKLEVEFLPFSGLLTDFLKSKKVNVLMRGIRNFSDFTHEQELSRVYLELYKKTTPVYFMSSPETSHISATVVRELVNLDADISGFVEKAAIPLIQKAYSKK